MGTKKYCTISRAAEVRNMLNRFEQEMSDEKVFGPKEGWDEALRNGWDMYRMAALLASTPEIEFYNESCEREDDL